MMSKLSFVAIAIATLAVLPGCLGMNSSNTNTGGVMTGTDMATGTTVEAVVETVLPEVVMDSSTGTTMTGTDMVTGTTMTGTDMATGTTMTGTMN